MRVDQVFSFLKKFRHINLESRYKSLDSTPCPPAISFGWEQFTSKTATVEKVTNIEIKWLVQRKESIESKQVRARFQWQGMMDSYISYITLARAVKIFSKYGEAQVLKDSSY